VGALWWLPSDVTGQSSPQPACTLLDYLETAEAGNASQLSYNRNRHGETNA